MKIYLAILGISLSLVAWGDSDHEKKKNKKNAQHTSIDKEPLINEAKGAVKALAVSLKTELMTAMKAGGPSAALDVCATKAQQITTTIASEKHITLGRISLKPRNPKNTPNAWQQTVLNDFETRKAKGEKPNSLVYAEIVTDSGKKRFRFMKAIPTGGLCLTCHGETLAADISTKIKEKYPDDKATGFNVGDLRGAFYVEKAL